MHKELRDDLKPGRAGLYSLLLCLLIAGAWLGTADRHAHQHNAENLERALITYAAARGLNAVISVAQGTEIAIQPIGIGVTLTIGEALDPLNDLIERFSWVILIAAASLGAQALMLDLGGTLFMNIAVSTAAVGLLLTLWFGGVFAGATLRKIFVFVLFLRFVVVAVSLAGSWIDDYFLASRQAQSLAVIEQTGAELKALDVDESPQASPSLVERITGISSSTDLKAQIEQLRTRVEATISELIKLAAAFALQTILLPLLLLWFGLTLLKRFT